MQFFYKLGEFSQNVTQIILDFCNTNFLDSNSENYDENNNLVEAGLNVVETYIFKLSTSLKPYFEEIIQTALELSKYDPNYSYETAVNIDYSEYDEEMWDYYGAAVDDSSWKVRRAAVRVLFAFVKSRAQLSKDVYANIICTLVFNLREHEKNVKMDIIYCLSSFVRNLVISEVSDKLSLEADLSLARINSMAPTIIPKILGEVVDQLLKDFKQNEEKIKEAELQLLTALATVGAENMVDYFGNFKDFIMADLIADKAFC